MEVEWLHMAWIHKIHKIQLWRFCGVSWRFLSTLHSPAFCLTHLLLSYLKFTTVFAPPTTGGRRGTEHGNIASREDDEAIMKGSPFIEICLKEWEQFYMCRYESRSSCPQGKKMTVVKKFGKSPHFHFLPSCEGRGNVYVFTIFFCYIKLDRVGPVDNRPSPY